MKDFKFEIDEEVYTTYRTSSTIWTITSRRNEAYTGADNWYSLEDGENKIVSPEKYLISKLEVIRSML